MFFISNVRSLALSCVDKATMTKTMTKMTTDNETAVNETVVTRDAPVMVEMSFPM